MSAFWSQGDRDERLTRQWHDGVLLPDIAANFGVSRGSVQRRIRTLDLPMRRAPAKKCEGEWPPEAETWLRELWGQANPVLSASEIGRRMHRSKNSVVAKAHRMGLPGRESPIVRAAEGEGPGKTPWQVRRDMAGLTRAERLAVLQFQVAALARETADPALFVALLAEALRKQLGVVA